MTMSKNSSHMLNEAGPVTSQYRLWDVPWDIGVCPVA
jgi:hypothetical protein